MSGTVRATTLNWTQNMIVLPSILITPNPPINPNLSWVPFNSWNGITRTFLIHHHSMSDSRAAIWGSHLLINSASCGEGLPTMMMTWTPFILTLQGMTKVYWGCTLLPLIAALTQTCLLYRKIIFNSIHLLYGLRLTPDIVLVRVVCFWAWTRWMSGVFF